MVKYSEKWNWNRLYSALIVPMDKEKHVNYSALVSLVNAQIEDGVEGFYCCGSSGEGLLLTVEEREKILETVLNAVEGRVPVISHVGTIRTEDAITLAVHAKQAGAAAISMIPPYYYNFSMDEIIQYYEDILDAVPDFPGIIYNVPQFTGVEFTSKNAKCLLKNPQILGVKHTSQNMFSMERITADFPDKIIFNGYDEQFLASLSMGATATIGTTVNLFCPLFKKVRDLYEKGDMQGALRAQREIDHRVEVMSESGIFNAVKYGWSLRGIECGQCRSPFQPLSNNSKKAIKELMAEDFE